MRVIMDLQPCQGESRYRGIGRYSFNFSRALIESGPEHEFILLVNGAVPETIHQFQREFSDLIPPQQIVAFHAPTPASTLDRSCIYAAEKIRRHFIAGLKPDVVHIHSLFEDHNFPISIDDESFITSVTLYDLIPLVYSSRYLSESSRADWYHGKLRQLKRADILMAISDNSRNETIGLLDIPERKVINISGAADKRFRILDISSTDRTSIRERYGLSRKFLMYTGGIDFRKNIEGLIEAYSHLSVALRAEFQLAIVCSVNPTEKDKLILHAQKHGLSEDEVVITGFVPDDDLRKLYNICHLFIFPSLYEGFGLPILEAMSCGAAVIGSNNSSIPEVIGREDALFDPTSPQEIASAINKVLGNERFRQNLRAHSLAQAQKFTWKECGRRAIQALEKQYAERAHSGKSFSRPGAASHRLAYFSPLPPEESGISDYSAELLLELGRHYEITLINDRTAPEDARSKLNFERKPVKWFEKNANKFDRIIYNFGNSTFHKHMFGLLDRHPGIVILHDFFLSGIAGWMQSTRQTPGFLLNSLYYSHGYPAVRLAVTDGTDAAEKKYPANKAVLDRATGVIVHSAYAKEIAAHWYGDEIAREWRVIPHLRAPKQSLTRDSARHLLKYDNDTFLICSFGMMGPTKENHRLLDAFLASPLADNRQTHLVFVGENDKGRYGESLRRKIETSGKADQIKITGFVSTERYEQYLAAADIAVQLRTFSRGETSGSALDCLVCGLPLIANANGSMAELPDSCLMRLPDIFDDGELRSALQSLHDDPALRKRLGDSARDYVRENHHPSVVGDLFRDAIEFFSCSGSRAKYRELINDISSSHEGVNPNAAVLLEAARCIAANIPESRPKQILLDISRLALNDPKLDSPVAVRYLLWELLAREIDGYRVEPVYLKDKHFHYARSFTSNFLELFDFKYPDSLIDIQAGDVFIGIDLTTDLINRAREEILRFNARDVEINYIMHEALPPVGAKEPNSSAQHKLMNWLKIVGSYANRLICLSPAAASEAQMWMRQNPLNRNGQLQIVHFHPGSDARQTPAVSPVPENANQPPAQTWHESVTQLLRVVGIAETQAPSQRRSI